MTHLISEPDRKSAFPTFFSYTKIIYDIINLLHFVQLRVTSRDHFQQYIFLIGNRCYELVCGVVLAGHLER